MNKAAIEINLDYLKDNIKTEIKVTLLQHTQVMVALFVPSKKVKVLIQVWGLRRYPVW